MTGAVAVISAALALGPLPERGLALETPSGGQLQSLGGRPLATLRGLDLAADQAIAHKAVFRDRRGRAVRARRRSPTSDVATARLPHDRPAADRVSAND